MRAGAEQDAFRNAPESRALQEVSASHVSPLLPLAMASGLFMDLLDTAALGTALPALAREFETDPVHVRLALTAYLLTMAVFTPASGWLADRLGARRVFVNAMKVYLLGALCCGLADSLEQLIAARVLQGVGGAMMTPVARLIVVASTPPRRLVQALNAFTIPAVIGPLLGPPLAGLLLEYASWRWIFFINIPFGLLGIAAVLRVVPRLRAAHPGRFDVFGFMCVGLGITNIMVLSESVGTGLLSAEGKLCFGAAAAAAWAAFIRHARRSENPVLDLRMLSRRSYCVSIMGGSLLRLSVAAVPFLTPLMLQVALGWTAVKTGTVMTAVMIGAILARFAGTWAVRLFGFRSILMLTALATALCTAAQAGFDTGTPLASVVALLLAGGFFRAAHFVAAGTIAYADIRPEEVSRASTLSTVIQQVSLSFGVSLAGGSLYLAAGEVDRLTANDFVLPFAAVGVAAALAVPIYARLSPQAGAHMRQQRESKT